MLPSGLRFSFSALQEAGDNNQFCWRNLFSCINLLRILNKLTKWKHSRTMVRWCPVSLRPAVGCQRCTSSVSPALCCGLQPSLPAESFFWQCWSFFCFIICPFFFHRLSLKCRNIFSSVNNTSMTLKPHAASIDYAERCCSTHLGFVPYVAQVLVPKAAQTALVRLF